MIELLRLQPKQTFKAKDDNKEKLNIPKVLDYIGKNYKDITLQKLASDLHFHENYLSRKIKEHMKMSFQEYLLDVRLNEAEQLLKNTDLTIKEVAYEVGYKKPSFFYKIFKERYEKTPQQFRGDYLTESK